MRLREPGGRTVERTLTLPVAARLPRIGIKPLFEGSALQEGATAAFEVIAVDAMDKQVAMAGLKWELVRLEQRWQWYKRDGTWAYDSVTISRKVGDGTVDTRGDSAVKIGAPVGWGRYRLDVRFEDQASLSSSFLFTAGWHATADVDSPGNARGCARQGEL